MTDQSLSPEEQYFLERETERRIQLREKMEQKAALLKEKGDLAEAVGSDDKSLIDRLHALGLESEVADVLHLVPLVEVAWADGSVSSSERSAIMRVVATHGAKPGSAAANFIVSMLEAKPSDTLLDEMRGVLRKLMKARGLKPQSLLQACQDVATASGGIFGFGNKISDDERQAIHDVAQALGDKAQRGIARWNDE